MSDDPQFRFMGMTKLEAVGIVGSVLTVAVIAVLLVLAFQLREAVRRADAAESRANANQALVSELHGTLCQQYGVSDDNIRLAEAYLTAQPHNRALIVFHRAWSSEKAALSGVAPCPPLP